MTTFHVNPSARPWTYDQPTVTSPVHKFHESLPGYKITPLIPLPSLAEKIGVKAVFVKDESSRLGLPAFKVLGAWWATYRTIAAAMNLPLDSTLEKVATAAQEAHFSLFAATSGNHGRAIARIATELGLPATIFLGDNPAKQVCRNIATEGAKVVVVDGTYDDAVAVAARETKATQGALHIQDYAWDGYSEVAEWVVEGYSTMLHETEQQLRQQNLQATHIVTPVGAGTLALAVVAHAKSGDRLRHGAAPVAVVAVEPDTAACLNDNLRRDELRPIAAGKTTIMTGMVCDNVNPVAWPALRRGVDVSLTVTDRQCHEAIEWLRAHGFNPGPCGAAALAGLRELVAIAGAAEEAELDEHSVVVLLSTEGERFYRVPVPE